MQIKFSRGDFPPGGAPESVVVPQFTAVDGINCLQIMLDLLNCLNNVLPLIHVF
jgi:hypothetical protein